jgi:hypothetical protein
MTLRYDGLTQGLKRLPRRTRTALTVLGFLLLFVVALCVGESLGKALYFMTH